MLSSLGRASVRSTFVQSLPQTTHPTSGLLVSVAPITNATAFYPDAGLARLSAALIGQGNRVQVLDYATLDTMRKLVPRPVQRELKIIWGNIQERRQAGQEPRAKDTAQLFLYGRAVLKALERKVAGSIAAEISQKVREREVDWVGFKLWNGAGFTMPALIARILKQRHPQLEIFGGGSQVDYFGSEIFRAAPAFDVLVSGVGEVALLRHANRIGVRKSGGAPEALSEIPSSIYPWGELTAPSCLASLDAYPLPIYDPEVYPAMTSQKLRMFIVIDSQGCDSFCKFCGHSIIGGGAIQARRPENIVAEMKQLQERFGANFFRLGGSSTPGSVLSEIARLNLNQGLGLKYSSFARVKDMVGLDYPALAQGGWQAAFLGIESGSQRILDRMTHKLVKLETARAVVAALNRAGIDTVESFIFPAPGEDAASRADTLRFIEETDPSGVLATPPIVIPGTPWANEPSKFGIELDPRFMSKAVTYPFTTAMPPNIFPVFPWTVDGKDSRRMLAELLAFTAELRAAGRTVGLAEDVIVMAKRLGMKPSVFGAESYAAFLTGDADRIEGWLQRWNQGLKEREGDQR